MKGRACKHCDRVRAVEHGERVLPLKRGKAATAPCARCFAWLRGSKSVSAEDVSRMNQEGFPYLDTKLEAERQDRIKTKLTTRDIGSLIKRKYGAKDDEPNISDEARKIIADAVDEVLGEPTADPVAHPAHYTQGGVEVIDAIEAWALNFRLGNAVKYIARAGKKDPAKLREDLQKAKWYLERELSALGAA